jgi:hypothetical protein
MSEQRRIVSVAETAKTPTTFLQNCSKASRRGEQSTASRPKPCWQHRVGDSPPNVITPPMPYFTLIVVFFQRYDKEAGVGTVVAIIPPYGVAVSIVWFLLFLA